jgi:hypothetical protein
LRLRVEGFTSAYSADKARFGKFRREKEEFRVKNWKLGA